MHPALVDGGVFTTSGGGILLDGEAFAVEGVCYQPAPIGEDPSAGPPYGDYYTSGYADLWARDFANIRKMGANVVRIYGWTIGADHTAFLEEACNDGEKSLYLLVNRWINPYTDWANPVAVSNLVSDWEAVADELKDHPAVMGFLIGNETNKEAGNGDNPDFWNAMNQVAGAVKAIAPDKLVSVAITDKIYQVSAWDAAMTNLDFWGVQVYRGVGFLDFFDQYAAASTKPLIITEFGYDAYNALTGAEFTEDAKLPAVAMENLWRELRINQSIASGGCVFEYADEWWKAGSPSTHDAPPGWDGPFADGEGNEEWWGIFRILDNGTSPDIHEPRAMFYRLAAMWNEPFGTRLGTAMAGDKLQIHFTYPIHLRDQQMVLGISTDLVSWTPVADNATSRYLTSFTPTVNVSNTESGETVLVDIVHDPSAGGPTSSSNLLGNGGFESGDTTGWVAFATVSSAYAHAGDYSLRFSTAGGMTVPVAYQSIPASPGDEFNLSGYILTDTAIPADPTIGLFKIVFQDILGNDLQPASVSIGGFAEPGFPGGESLPLMNAQRPVGTWMFSEVQAVAPAGTAYVFFFAISVDQSPVSMYFDSIEAIEVAVPPPIDSTVFFRLINHGR
ncbi:MAG: hypothetical protein ACP5I4_04865 [Oceanipulchritudo sp.]